MGYKNFEKIYEEEIKEQSRPTMTPKFKITFGEKGDPNVKWTETYWTMVKNPKAFAKDLAKKFNDERGPREPERVVIKVEVLK